MDDEAGFLRPDAIIEPLVDGSYGWLHTVAPVQAAMNLAFVQVPLLESYLQSPQVRIKASSNPDHGIKSDHLFGQHEWLW